MKSANFDLTVRSLDRDSLLKDESTDDRDMIQLSKGGVFSYEPVPVGSRSE